jgi:ATP-binding cassette subfamily F protein 3
MLRLDAVTLAPGGEPLLLDADWHVHPGEHVGLVGRNGTGKTTLLRAIVGEQPVDGGRIHLRPGARIGWLPQQAVSGSTRPVWDEVSSRMGWYHALQAELDAAMRAADAGQPGSDQRLADATERFRAAGGYAVDETIGTVLSGLGFGPDRWRQPCDTFSGGWQMRIALARLLLAQPDLALLDEPTNHLDLEARSWLAGYLQQVPWTFVVVSHDRWLLDRAVDRIGEIRGQQLHTYVGNFSRFVVERESRLSDQANRFARQQEEIARLERFIERFGAKATKASQARSRQNALDRIERIDAPERLGKLPKLRLPEAPPGELEAVGLRDAALGWGDAVVVEGVTFDLERGMRLAVLGPNGVGKSTLLHALAGRLPPIRGRRRVGDRSRIGVFTQDLAQDLPGEPSGLAHVSTLAPTVPPQQIRATLGALGLAPDAAERPIRELSGGEKARVALAALAVRPHNVLLLDEPTNHLDAESVAALVDALHAYAGAVLLVTHDRWLVERVATHVGRIANGRFSLHPGVRPDDFEPIAPAAAHDAHRRQTDDGGEHVDRKRIQRERERVRRRIQELERDISAAEAALARLDEALYAVTDFQASRAAAQEREAAAARVDALYAEWEGLEARLVDG